MTNFRERASLLFATSLAFATGSVPAFATDYVTYSWTTTSEGFGSHVDQPSSATFQVPLSAVLSGTISYFDITNIQLGYAGLTFDAYTQSSIGLDNAAFVDPATGAFIYSDANQGLAVIGYEGGLFSDSFLSITVDNPNSGLTGVADVYNALDNGQPFAGYPTAGYWTAQFPTISGSVPEPSSWVMLIAGFGLVGMALRRRRQNVTTTVRYA